MIITESLDIVEESAQDEESEDKQKATDKNLPKKIAQVKVLTKKDTASGKYSIFDIVLPLPGHHIKYPPNMRAYYEELLTKDGLNLEMKNVNK